MSEKNYSLDFNAIKNDVHNYNQEQNFHLAYSTLHKISKSMDLNRFNNTFLNNKKEIIRTKIQTE